MKFDVIVGNPPYQLNVGNTTGNSSKAKSIYHMFIEQAKKLNPRYLTMIVPSRWMTRSVEGIPDKWIDDMLNENKISVIYDFLNSQDCFPGVQIEGGVNYFLWDRDYKKECRYILNINKHTIYERVDFLNSNKTDIIIRDPFAINIIEKVNILNPNYIKNSEKNFSSIVSPKDFFTNKTLLTSSWKDYKKEEDIEHNIKYFLNKNIHKVEYGWISLNNIPKNIEVVKEIKNARVYICGLGFYEMYINGDRIGDQMLAPAVTNYDKRTIEHILYPRAIAAFWIPSITSALNGF
jgi:site-specific DNA-methyltransferase (adenine-specific)